MQQFFNQKVILKLTKITANVNQQNYKVPFVPPTFPRIKTSVVTLSPEVLHS